MMKTLVMIHYSYQWRSLPSMDNKLNLFSNISALESHKLCEYCKINHLKLCMEKVHMLFHSFSFLFLFEWRHHNHYPLGVHWERPSPKTPLWSFEPMACTYQLHLSWGALPAEQPLRVMLFYYKKFAELYIVWKHSTSLFILCLKCKHLIPIFFIFPPFFRFEYIFSTKEAISFIYIVLILTWFRREDLIWIWLTLLRI